METRSSNRLRPVQPALTLQPNGRTAVVALKTALATSTATPRRRCRSETTAPASNGHFSAAGSFVESQFKQLDGDRSPFEQRKLLQHQQMANNFRGAQFKCAANSSPVLRNQESSQNIFTCQTLTMPAQTTQSTLYHQLHQLQQQPLNGRTSRLSRQSAGAPATVAPPNQTNGLYSSSTRRKENVHDHIQQSLRCMPFDHTAPSSRGQSGYDIVTRSSARKPTAATNGGSALLNGGGADSAKRRFRSRSESDPHEHRRQTSGNTITSKQRSPTKASGTAATAAAAATVAKCTADVSVCVDSATDRQSALVAAYARVPLEIMRR